MVFDACDAFLDDGTAFRCMLSSDGSRTPGQVLIDGAGDERHDYASHQVLLCSCSVLDRVSVDGSMRHRLCTCASLEQDEGGGGA